MTNDMISRENGLAITLPVETKSTGLRNGQKQVLRLAVLMTCYNRKQTTLKCLQTLAANTGLEEIELSVVLVDDGSTDGTAEAVKAQFPWVQVDVGSSNLFWCRGMHKACEIALQGGYDYYVWLNDDTLLYPDAVSRLLACEQKLRLDHSAPVIVVGSSVDEKTGMLTYGGEMRVGRRNIRFRKVEMAEFPKRCDSMNGNIVLISAQAMGVVGNLDPAFEHAMGDTDYALRANRLGVSVWTAPGIFGECSHNSVPGTFIDSNLPLRQRWKAMMGRKGLPWRSWLVMTRRHCGWLWPVYFLRPYVRVVIESAMRGKLR